jgi:hypothetical protein
MKVLKVLFVSFFCWIGYDRKYLESRISSNFEASHIWESETNRQKKQIKIKKYKNRKYNKKRKFQNREFKFRSTKSRSVRHSNQKSLRRMYRND